MGNLPLSRNPDRNGICTALTGGIAYGLYSLTRFKGGRKQRFDITDMISIIGSECLAKALTTNISYLRINDRIPDTINLQPYFARPVNRYLRQAGQVQLLTKHPALVKLQRAVGHEELTALGKTIHLFSLSE